MENEKLLVFLPEKNSFAGAAHTNCPVRAGTLDLRVLIHKLHTFPRSGMLAGVCWVHSARVFTIQMHDRVSAVWRIRHEELPCSSISIRMLIRRLLSCLLARASSSCMSSLGETPQNYSSQLGVHAIIQAKLLAAEQCTST